jgi:hypothetical protein
VGLVIVGAIVITVPFLASFTLDAVSLLAPVFNLVACILVADDVTQVPSIPVSAALLQWSDAAGRLPVWAWEVVRVLTHFLSPCSGGRVLDDSCIQHGLEALDLCVDLLTVFR